MAEVAKFRRVHLADVVIVPLEDPIVRLQALHFLLLHLVPGLHASIGLMHRHILELLLFFRNNFALVDAEAVWGSDPWRQLRCRDFHLRCVFHL